MSPIRGAACKLACCLFAALQSPAQTPALWPDADRLFHSDPRWLGADAAFSVDLGHGRVLWLFGDSFVSSKPGATRRQSRMARNTIAIQTGYDPANASIRFYWKEEGSGSFFPDEANIWYWPSHGIRLGKRLLLFYNVVRTTGPGPFGFLEDGVVAFLIPNPDDDPMRWNIRKIELPPTPRRMMIGIAVVRSGNQIYLWASGEPKHDIYLLRASAAKLANGDFSAMEWWCGDQRGWRTQPRTEGPPEPLFHEGQTELSVQYDSARKQYILVQTVGFGGTDISIRTATRPTGPWTPLRKIYRPPESSQAGAWVYAAKSHPELQGADLVITYAVNAAEQRLADDMSIYFPRFVRVALEH